MNEMILTYDYETTGVDPRKDRPVQIGLIAGIETPRICMNAYVDPCMAIDPGASNVHGITADAVQGHPDYIMGVYTMVSIIEKMGRGLDIIIAGYNHEKFDNVMTDTCMGGKAISKYKQLDLMRALRRYYPKLSSHKLGIAYQELLGRELVGAHGAIQDCLGCAELLTFMQNDIGKSAGQLAIELQTPQVFPIMPIGKHKGKRVQDVDLGWARWMRTNAKDMDPDLQATVDYIMTGCPGAV